jgi:selenocysteine lyase/cysteine desulfurase
MGRAAEAGRTLAASAVSVVDPERWRADTPGTAHCRHLNNAGASLMPRPVLEAVRTHLDLEALTGGYEAADLARDAIAAVYDDVGSLLGAPAANVALTENATAAFQQALSAVPFRSGDVLLTTRNDYVSNQIQYLSLERRLGIEVVRAPDLPEGGVDPQAMFELIHRRRPRLVALTHVPTSSGMVQDAAAVGRHCRERDVLYLVDACQSVGQMPVSVDELGCDFLSATARKFLRGPRGVGFLYVSDRALAAGLEPLFPDLRGADWVADDLYQPAPDARRFENWEFPYALVLGLGAAARYALEVGTDIARDRARALAERLREGLADVPGAEVLDRGAELCAIVTVRVAGWPPGALVAALRREKIHTSAVGREAAVLDFDSRGVEGALRASPHYYNTEREIDVLLAALAALAGEAARA